MWRLDSWVFWEMGRCRSLYWATSSAQLLACLARFTCLVWALWALEISWLFWIQPFVCSFPETPVWACSRGREHKFTDGIFEATPERTTEHFSSFEEGAKFRGKGLETDHQRGLCEGRGQHCSWSSSCLHHVCNMFARVWFCCRFEHWLCAQFVSSPLCFIAMQGCASLGSTWKHSASCVVLKQQWLHLWLGG